MKDVLAKVDIQWAPKMILKYVSVKFIKYYFYYLFKIYCNNYLID